MMNLRILHVAGIFACTLSLQSYAQSANPFEFKKKEDPPPTQVSAPVVTNPDLSVAQRNDVADMIKKAISSMDMALVDKGNIVDVKGEQHVVLRQGQRYVGIASGMHVVYSESTQDYEYFDSRKYRSVIAESDFKSMMDDAKSKAMGVLQSFGNSSDADSEYELPEGTIPATHESFSESPVVMPVEPVSPPVTNPQAPAPQTLQNKPDGSQH